MYSNNRWRILTCFADALTELLLCRLFVCVISPVVQFTSEHYKQHSQSLWMANVDHTMFTLSPIGQRSTVMSMSVCLCTCVCLSARMSSELYIRSSPNFLYMLPMAMPWSSSGSIVIHYVLPVLWMTSYLLISQACLMSPPSWSTVHMQAALGLAINCAQ